LMLKTRAESNEAMATHKPNRVGAGPPLRLCKGENDEAGGHEWKIGTRAA
jgi:hypothetical protein